MKNLYFIKFNISKSTFKLKMYKYIIIYLHFKQNEELFIIMKIAISKSSRMVCKYIAFAISI